MPLAHPLDPNAAGASPLPAVVDALADKGWHVQAGFLPESLVGQLRAECLVRQAAGSFQQAGIGAGRARVISEVRGDAIHWLEAGDPSSAVQDYLARMEALREAVNATLYLGLFELEAHFAAYPAGAFYRRHLDRFRDDDRRTLTAIVYLNEAWTAVDGGLLRLWTEADGAGEPLEIVPAGGTLVTFLSDRFWHEVLPARRQRLALTGWFKRR
jgi:SM-20-related protein